MSTREGDAGMIKIERASVNLWSMGALVVGIGATCFGWGITYSTLTSQIDGLRTELRTEVSNRVERSADVNEQLKDIKADLVVTGSLQYETKRLGEQIQETRRITDETNQRINRYMELNGDKLDKITDAVAKISTQVEVISNKIGAGPPRKYGAVELSPQLQ